MNICVFAYNFKHKKTQEGLYKLIQNNIKIDCVLLADFVKLNFVPAKIRVGVKDMIYEEPKNICERFNLPYKILNHNSLECKSFLEEINPDLGVILGSRIIKKFIIDEFKIGILNLHPGLLPENRGLDNIKWAINKNIKQGVTSHLINSEIDRGVLIEKTTVNVYDDDSLTDIFLRIQNKELDLMISSINKISGNLKFTQHLGEGFYHKQMTEQEEFETMNSFDNYKKMYYES